MGWHYNSFLGGKQWPFIFWHAFIGREIQIASLLIKLCASHYCCFPYPSFFLLSQCDKSRRLSTDIFWAGPVSLQAVVTVVVESLWDVLWLVLHSNVATLKWTEFLLLFYLLVVRLRVSNLIWKLSNSASMSVLFVANSSFGRSFLTGAVCALSSPSYECRFSPSLCPRVILQPQTVRLHFSIKAVSNTWKYTVLIISTKFVLFFNCVWRRTAVSWPWPAARCASICSVYEISTLPANKVVWR